MKTPKISGHRIALSAYLLAVQDTVAQIQGGQCMLGHNLETGTSPNSALTQPRVKEPCNICNSWQLEFVQDHYSRSHLLVSLQNWSRKCL